MILVNILAYLADVAVLVSYLLVTKGKSVQWMHLANAVGCIPIFVTEVAVQAWPPLVLTVAFGVIGWIGIWGGSRA